MAQQFEYRVVPAPRKGVKSKTARTAEDRFANAVEITMNEMARDGWEYLRADALPTEVREGLMSKTTVVQNLLVFRRSLAKDHAQISSPASAAPRLAGPAVSANASDKTEPPAQESASHDEASVKTDDAVTVDASPKPEGGASFWTPSLTKRSKT